MYLSLPGCRLKVASQAARRTSQSWSACCATPLAPAHTPDAMPQPVCPLMCLRRSAQLSGIFMQSAPGTRRLPCPARVMGGEVDVLARFACHQLNLMAKNPWARLYRSMITALDKQPGRARTVPTWQLARVPEHYLGVWFN